MLLGPHLPVPDQTLSGLAWCFCHGRLVLAMLRGKGLIERVELLPVHLSGRRKGLPEVDEVTRGWCYRLGRRTATVPLTRLRHVDYVSRRNIPRRLCASPGRWAFGLVGTEVDSYIGISRWRCHPLGGIRSTPARLAQGGDECGCLLLAAAAAATYGYSQAVQKMALTAAGGRARERHR